LAKGGDIPKLSSDRMPERIACRQVSENSITFPPFEKGGSGGISIVILITQKSVIPNSPHRLPCHPGKHQRAGHSSNLLPPPAVFPTADSSPRFARFGMTRESDCHPEEYQPPVSSREASASKALLEFAPASRRIPDCRFLTPLRKVRNDTGERLSSRGVSTSRVIPGSISEQGTPRIRPRLPPYSRLQIPHPASQGSE
jgi:hypothetical protein